MVRLANTARSFIRRVRQRTLERAIQERTAKITEILESSRQPDTRHAELCFESLQKRYLPRPEYGYDLVSLWKRGSSRSQTLVTLSGMETSEKKVLDVGGGDGMLAVALNAFGHDVTLIDQDDWRHDRARSVPLVIADCSKEIPFEKDTFDLTCSYNSFEHFSEPAITFAEMLRVTKPRGWIYLEFNPLFASPWGLHAYRSLRMPYPQFLFSDSFVRTKLSEMGMWDLGQKRTELQHLNQWRPDQFEQLWSSADCRVVVDRPCIDDSALSLIEEFPESFQGRNLTIRDITLAGICIAIVKN